MVPPGHLDVEDIVKTREGIVLTLRWSKTDQEGKGTEIAIPKGHLPGDDTQRLAYPGENQGGVRSSARSVRTVWLKIGGSAIAVWH